MKQIWVLPLLFIVILTGCDKPKPIVVLDGRWNAGFAKETCRRANDWHKKNAAKILQIDCEEVAECSEMMAVVEACVLDPVQDVQVFEYRLVTAFARNPACSAVQFVHFKYLDKGSKAISEALQKQHWLLGLDYNPGAQRQHWWMIHSPGYGALLQGEGSPDEIAAKVCKAVRPEGKPIINPPGR
jgi:hypothetical protein